jgi:hypothetical protein
MSEPTSKSVSVGDELVGKPSRKLAASVSRTAADGPRAIDERLRALDKEWDIDRVVVEARALAATLTGLALGSVGGRARAPWAAFLLERSRGSNPPQLLLRACGFRSASEIESERSALSAARGTRHPASPASYTFWARGAAPAE